jgi:hypothetical protein
MDLENRKNFIAIYFQGRGGNRHISVTAASLDPVIYRRHRGVNNLSSVGAQLPK